MTSTRGAGMTPRSTMMAGCAVAMPIPQPTISMMAQAVCTKCDDGFTPAVIDPPNE